MLSCKCLILAQVWFFVLVAIWGMTSGLMGRSAKISSRFVILGELTMALGNGRLNSVGDTDKYNQLLKPKWNIS